MTVPRVIVLGVNHPSALAVIRSVGRARIPVVAVDPDPTAKSFRSHYITERRVIGAGPDAALAELERLGRSGGGVVIPTNDDYLSLLSRHFESLSRHLHITVPPWDVLGALLLKDRSFALAREIGLTTPTFHVPADVAELDVTLESLDFDAKQYLLTKVDPTAPGVVDVRTGRAIIGAGRDIASAREACLGVQRRTGALPMIVEVVPGEADTATGVSMVVDRAHNTVVCYGVRRLQLYPHARLQEFVHPYDLGWNVYCETVHDEEAVDAAQRYVKHARFYGAITMEFRRDATSGALVFIKADARVERATALSTALGMDVGLALHRVFTDQPIVPSGAYPEHVGWLWCNWYMGRLWENRSRSPFGHEVRALAAKLPRVAACAYFDPGDPLPFLLDCGRWGRRWFGAAVRRAMGQTVRVVPPRPA
jgi:D-aspartate ligase